MFQLVEEIGPDGLGVADSKIVEEVKKIACQSTTEQVYIRGDNLETWESVLWSQIDTNRKPFSPSGNAQERCQFETLTANDGSPKPTGHKTAVLPERSQKCSAKNSLSGNPIHMMVMNRGDMENVP